MVVYELLSRNYTLLSNRNIIALLLLFTTINFADLFTTLFALNTGFYEELNLFIAFLYSKSPLLMAIYKILIPLVPFILLLKCKKVRIDDYSTPTIAEKIRTVVISSVFLAMLWSTLVYVFIVVHNFILIFETSFN
jgi:hypothetical protein